MKTPFYFIPLTIIMSSCFSEETEQRSYQKSSQTFSSSYEEKIEINEKKAKISHERAASPQKDATSTQNELDAKVKKSPQKSSIKEPATSKEQEKPIEKSPTPPPIDPYKVTLTIKEGCTGTSPINSLETAVQGKLYPGKKQVLEIKNECERPFRLHGSGRAPCGHADISDTINKGETYSCEISSLSNAAANQSAIMYNHIDGNATRIFINVIEAPDPVIE